MVLDVDADDAAILFESAAQIALTRPSREAGNVNLSVRWVVELVAAATTTSSFSTSAASSAGR